MLHLAEKVNRLDPLWANNCFYYEDYNGDLSQMFHGSQSIAVQVLTAVTVQLKIPIAQKIFNTESKEFSFFQKLVMKSHHRVATKHQYSIENGQTVAGILRRASLLPSIKALVQSNYGLMTQIMEFHRLLTKGIVIHSQKYGKVSRRNSYTVCYIEENKKKSMVLFSFT